LDLVVAGTRDAVTMIEGFAREMSEDNMFEAIRFAHRQIGKVVDLIEELRHKAGLGPKPVAAPVAVNPLIDAVRQRFGGEFRELKQTSGKHARTDKIRDFKDRIRKEYLPEGKTPEHTPQQVAAALEALEERA